MSLPIVRRSASGSSKSHSLTGMRPDGLTWNRAGNFLERSIITVSKLAQCFKHFLLSGTVVQWRHKFTCSQINSKRRRILAAPPADLASPRPALHIPQTVGPILSDLIEQARLAARSVKEYGEGLINPTVRLGITGLSRAGKTVFITALVHGLVRNGRFPVFEALSEGRIVRARLAPQPDDAVPRFDYESHVRALVADRVWPESPRQISELRLVIEYQSRSGTMRELVLDMVDYPGEWLLDLPLLSKSFETWSAETLELSRREPRARLAAPRPAPFAALAAAGARAPAS